MKNETTTTAAPAGSQIPMDVTVSGLSSVDKRNGFLKKLGGKGISKNWRRRFFVLTNNGILYYFKQKTAPSPVGAIDLSLYTKCYKDKSTKKNYFFLSNENDSSVRVFHLIADSAPEMEDWIREITSFFEGDLSDLKNHLMGVKQQKEEEKQLAADASVNGEREIDKFQLVFKGERVSLLLQSDQVNDALTPPLPQADQADSQSDSNSTENENAESIMSTSANSGIVIEAIASQPEQDQEQAQSQEQEDRQQSDIIKVSSSSSVNESITNTNINNDTSNDNNTNNSTNSNINTSNNDSNDEIVVSEDNIVFDINGGNSNIYIEDLRAEEKYQKAKNDNTIEDPMDKY